MLDAARRLFELPEADKNAIAMVRSLHFRGYTRPDVDLLAPVHARNLLFQALRP